MIDRRLFLNQVANCSLAGVAGLAFPGVVQNLDTVEDAPNRQSEVYLVQDGDYRGAVVFDTTGAAVPAPWIIHTMSAGNNDHDNVLLTTYNLRHNRKRGIWERVIEGEHGVRFGMESRWTTSDPSSERGLFEWNLQIERALSGPLTFDRAPWYLCYDFDNQRTLVFIGDENDDGNMLNIHAATVIDQPHSTEGYALRVRNGYALIEDGAVLHREAKWAGATLNGATARAVSIECGAAPDNLGSVAFVDIGHNTIGAENRRVQAANGLRVSGDTWNKGTDDVIIAATAAQLTIPTVGLFNAGLVIGAQNAEGNFAILSSSPHPSSLAGGLSVGGQLTLAETLAPTPQPNKAILYAEDAGGKTRLMVQFPSGAAQQLAIES